MSARLSAQRVSVMFAAPDGGNLPALGPVSFEVEAGQFVSLIGPSGCGKSTLVRVFAGLQQPSQGRVTIDGQPVDGPSPLTGMMFQQANLMPWRTVIDNVALPLELAGVPRAERQQQALDALHGLGLAGFERAYPGELSGGMAQRVALGRVLVQRPAALLLDEPFGALDALSRERIGQDLMRMWSQQRQTVVMVTHDIQEAVLLSDRVLVFSSRPGRIIADIAVDLSRPRLPEDAFNEDFAAVARQVREAINRA